MVTVVADRGAGKTSLLRRWQQQLTHTTDRPSIWLDQSDFTELLPLFERLAKLHRESEPSCILVDDFQALRDQEAQATVLGLVDRGPHQLVLASRPGVDLPLHRWRASGVVAEFGTSQLRLGPDAIARMADERELEIELGLVAHVAEQCHGFADAVATVLDQLVGVTSSDQLKAVESAIAAYAMDLADQIEQSVEQPVFKILARTSLLGRIDRQLSSAFDRWDVDGQGASTIDLMAVLRRAPFVEPADSSGRAVMVHPLARLGLQLRLRQLESTSEIMTIHRAAAQRLADLGRTREAIDHYLEAGEPLHAADLLLEVWSGDPSKVTDEDIRGLSTAGAEDYVPHMVTEARGLLRANEFAAARLVRNRLAARTWVGPVGPDFETLQHAIDEIDANLPDMTVEHMERYIESMAQLSATDGGPFRPAQRYTEAHYSYWLGRIPEAGERAASILVGHRSVGRENLREQIVTVLASDLQALISWDSGETRQAARNVARAVELLSGYGIDDLGAISEQALWVHLLARAVAGDGPVEDRMDLLDRIVDGVRSREVQIHAWIEQVCLLDRLHRFDDALDSLSRLDTAVAGWESPLVPLHADRLVALHDALRPARGRSGPAMHITTGERAVLYLLTDRALSQNDIAERLGLSINTVKSHLRSVYQKLGVTGRQEAVEEARARRLLVTVDPWFQPH